MSREDKIMEVNELAKRIKRDIPIKRYIRQRIVQEEIIDAYVSPLPSAVTVDGKPKMVEIGDMVIIRADGSQDAYSPDEFARIFELYNAPAPIETQAGDDDD